MREFIEYLVRNQAGVRKFLAALVTAVVVAASEGLLDESLVTVGVAFAGALGVYAVRND